MVRDLICFRSWIEANQTSYEGNCNGCGSCCAGFIFIGGTRIETRCENLVVAEPIGRPQATLCSVHGKRTLGMPIRMLLENGRSYRSRCLATYPRPQDAIPPECSYKYVGPSEKKPRWSIGYKPELGNLVCEIY